MSQLEERKYIIIGVFILVGLAFITRLFFIQVIDDSYKLDARNQSFRYNTEFPVRVHSEVNNIVSDKAKVAPVQFFPREQIFDGGGLAQVVALLDEKINLQFLRPQLRRQRGPRRNPADFHSRAPRQHDTEAVADVEPLYLALAADKDRTVRQNAVHVAQK